MVELAPGAKLASLSLQEVLCTSMECVKQNDKKKKTSKVSEEPSWQNKVGSHLTGQSGSPGLSGRDSMLGTKGTCIMV